MIAALVPQGHEVVAACGAGEGLRLAETGAFDVALVDFKFPDADGIEVACQVAECLPDARVYVMSGYELAEEDIGFPVLDKPFDFEKLFSAIGE